MATLLPVDSSFTVLSMIDRAYSLLGYKAAGEALSAADAEYARNALNSMIDGWTTQPMFIGSVGEVVATVSGATASIGDGADFDTLRPGRLEKGCFARIGGYDYQIDLIDRATYAAIADKAISGNVPRYAYYDATLPEGTVYFYPAPASVEIHLAVQTQLSEFSDVNAIVTMAPGYRKAIEYSLAEELAPGIREVPLSVVRIAQNARRAIRRSNVVVPLLDLPNSVRFDINTGS